MRVTAFNGITETEISDNIQTIDINVSANNVVFEFETVEEMRTVVEVLSQYEYTDIYFECYFKPHYSQGVYVDNLQLEVLDSKIICRGDRVRCA